MIYTDQPIIFGDNLVVGLSSADDGNMKLSRDDDNQTRDNQIMFLDRLSIDTTQTTLVQVVYQDTTDFTRYHVIDDDQQGEGMLTAHSDMQADALVVARPDHALFLPLADCIGAVIFDPTNKVLMVSHLGRHSLEANGGVKSVQYLETEFGSSPEDLLVWLSPAVGGGSYPLQAFGNRSLHQVAVEQLEQAGVFLEHVEVSKVDTAESDSYFSHSEYLAGTQSSDERFAIVAMMRD